MQNKLHDWIQIVGLFAVVASLVFVGYEVRISGQDAVSSTLLADNEVIVAVESLVIDNADTWLRGCRGDELAPTEQLIFTRIYQAYAFTNFLRWMGDVRGVGAGREDISIDNMAMLLYRSPGLHREWERHREWRAHMPDQIDFQRWRARVDARLAEYPVPIDNVSRCGLI